MRTAVNGGSELLIFVPRAAHSRDERALPSPSPVQRPGGLTTHHEKALTEQPGEREQPGREPDPPKAWPKSVIQVMLRTWPVSMLAAAYMPSEKTVAQRRVCSEPGPEDLANDQGEEPHHGQAPASAGGEAVVWASPQSCITRPAIGVVARSVAVSRADAGDRAYQWLPQGAPTLSTAAGSEWCLVPKPSSLRCRSSSYAARIQPRRCVGSAESR